MKKILAAAVLYTLLAVFILPYAVTSIFGGDSPEQKTSEETETKNYNVNLIKALNPETNEIIESSFEDYIKCVVGAEMPANFNEEALKAQAVAARTYAYRKIEEQNISNNSDALLNIGQAYSSVDELKEKWGAGFDKYYEKVSKAVTDTSGEIMVYQEEPILAVFHSTSSGKTETAENVWGSEVAYLKSVDSSFDEDAPNFETTSTIPVNTVIGKLQADDSALILTQARLIDQIQIIERSEAGYILKIQIGNKMYTGRKVREILGLRSSDFSVTQEGDNMVFTTKGYGHGAGMSQYGANFMAENGYTYKEILLHYYNNVEFTKIQ